MTELEEGLRASAQQNTDLEEEVRNLSGRLREEKDKYNALWRMNCDQLCEHDEVITAKEEELLSLGAQLAALGGGLHLPQVMESRVRSGKRPGDRRANQLTMTASPESGRLGGPLFSVPLRTGTAPRGCLWCLISVVVLQEDPWSLAGWTSSGTAEVLVLLAGARPHP